MTAKEKATELINTYYNYARSQRDAVQIVEGIILTVLCKKIDSLDGHIFFRNDFDDALIKSAIKNLKWWQEVAYEVSKVKNKIPVNA